MRVWVLRLHRAIGLGAAPFLFLLGVTGAILVWEEELDAGLNPELLQNKSQVDPLAPQILIDSIEAYLDETGAQNASLSFLVFPRLTDRSAIAYVTGVDRGNQVLVDTGSGEILGVRNTITPSLTHRAELIPWLYQFHYSLTAGQLAIKFLGVVAIIWLLDSLVAWYLTTPRSFSWQAWRGSWLIARRRIGYDLHRAIGLWLTPLFVVIATTGVYFNLYYEAFVPVVNTFSSITRQPYEEETIEPVFDRSIDYARALQLSRETLISKGVEINALDYVSWNGRAGYYAVAYYTDRDLSRDTPSGHVYVNGDGTIRHSRIVGEGTVGDLIIDWQFPLHSGQAFGMFGRLLIFATGVGLAVVSVTGVWLFIRKRRLKRFRGIGWQEGV